MKTPQLEPTKISLSPEYVNKLLGLNLPEREIKKLLERMRYGVNLTKGGIQVLVPAYRVDVLHPIDLVEDIAIAYGYNRFKLQIPKLYTTGKASPREEFSSQCREIFLGLGFQEIMTLILTRKESLFQMMNIPEGKLVEAEVAVSEEHSVARTWLLPSLMQILAKNKNREYPQRLFEIGDCIAKDGKDRRKLSAVIAHSRTNFSEIKAIAQGFLDTLALKSKLEKLEHGSFIPGRCASLDFGFLGEIHPKVLDNFSLETPVTALELDLGKILQARK